jgi:hypothetical protein
MHLAFLAEMDKSNENLRHIFVKNISTVNTHNNESKFNKMAMVIITVEAMITIVQAGYHSGKWLFGMMH